MAGGLVVGQGEAKHVRLGRLVEPVELEGRVARLHAGDAIDAEVFGLARLDLEGRKGGVVRDKFEGFDEPVGARAAVGGVVADKGDLGAVEEGVCDLAYQLRPTCSHQRVHFLLPLAEHVQLPDDGLRQRIVSPQRLHRRLHPFRLLIRERLAQILPSDERIPICIEHHHVPQTLNQIEVSVDRAFAHAQVGGILLAAHPNRVAHLPNEAHHAQHCALGERLGVVLAGCALPHGRSGLRFINSTANESNYLQSIAKLNSFVSGIDCLCKQNITQSSQPSFMAGYSSNLKATQEQLDDGETIIASCFGVYETKIMGADSGRNGVFLVTQKRVVFFGKKMFGYDMESFPLAKVSAIEMSKGLMGKSITLKMSGNDAKMKWINDGNPEELVNYVREHMGENTTPSPPSPATEDIPGQIQKLAELRDNGILTEEEFASKKKDLLAKM